MWLVNIMTQSNYIKSTIEFVQEQKIETDSESAQAFIHTMINTFYGNKTDVHICVAYTSAKSSCSRTRTIFGVRISHDPLSFLNTFLTFVGLIFLICKILGRVRLHIQ